MENLWFDDGSCLRTHCWRVDLLIMDPGYLGWSVKKEPSNQLATIHSTIISHAAALGAILSGNANQSPKIVVPKDHKSCCAYRLGCLTKFQSYCWHPKLFIVIVFERDNSGLYLYGQPAMRIPRISPLKSNRTQFCILLSSPNKVLSSAESLGRFGKVHI